MKSIPGVSLACASILASHAWSATPQLDDYAEGISIEARAGRPLIEVRIPDVVYRTTTQSDLADVSVFNAEGMAVPHAICAAPSLAEPVVTKEVLPVFMLQATPQPSNTEARIDLNTSLGTAVRIEESAPQATERPAPQTRAHVIDARGTADALRSIQFDWRSPDEASEVRVRIEASEDLDRWYTVVQASTLLQVEQEHRQLRRERIPIPQQRYQFLRVARVDGGPPLLIASVVAERVAEPLAIEPVWFTADLQASGEPDEWVFDAARIAPVTYARLRLTQDNVSVRIRIQSRSGEDEPWHERWSGESYAVITEGQRRVSAPARFSPAYDRHWRVLPAGANTLASSPMLELGYRPARLEFLAQGNGPYTLAFGSRRAAAGAARACGSLMADVRGENLAPFVAAGYVGAQRALGGESALQPPPQPTSLKQLVLWAVLVGGVGVLLAMALSLLKRVRPPT